MKARLAKKIMSQRPPACGGSDTRRHTMYYWHWRWLEWYNTTHPAISYKPCGLVMDHRISKAISLTKKRNNHIEKVRYCGNCCWFENEDACGMGWCSINDRETSCGQACILNFK